MLGWESTGSCKITPQNGKIEGTRICKTIKETCCSSCFRYHCILVRDYRIHEGCCYIQRSKITNINRKKIPEKHKQEKNVPYL